MRTKIKTSLATLLLLSGVLAAGAIPATAFAQNSTDRFLRTICPPASSSDQTGTQNVQGEPNLAVCVNNIYIFLLRVSGLIALIVLIFAGYIYMVAGGDGEKISKAKDLLWRVVQGVLILVIAYVFLKFLNPELVELKNPIEILNHGR